MTEYEKRLRADLQVARYDYYHAEDIDTKSLYKEVIIFLEERLLELRVQHAESFDIFE